MVKINGNRISMTRGDTMQAQVEIFDASGDPYEVQEGDRIRFAMKSMNKDSCGQILLYKEIPNSTLVVTLQPEDTENLPLGEYGYDIELTKANGVVDTFIAEAKIELRWEAD
jgi:hypothetical protein